MKCLRALMIGASLLIFVGVGCLRDPHAAGSVSLSTAPASALLLNAQAFPKGWQADPCNPSHCFGEANAWRTFGIVGVPGHVNQDIFRLDSEAYAHAKFQLYRESDFTKSPPPQVPSTDFLPPPEITYRSLIADEYYLGCGVDIVPACRAIFRYHNYLVEFYFDIDGGRGDGLKLQEVEPILRAMDDKASSILNVPLPTKAP